MSEIVWNKLCGNHYVAIFIFLFVEHIINKMSIKIITTKGVESSETIRGQLIRLFRADLIFFPISPDIWYDIFLTYRVPLGSVVNSKTKLE